MHELSHPDRHAFQSRRWIVSAALWILYIVGLVAISPSVGMGSVFGCTAYCLLGMLAISLAAYYATVGPTRRRFALACIAAIATVLTTYITFDLIIALCYAYPPPRPLFRNILIGDDRVLLPVWAHESHHIDSQNTIALVDHGENLIVMIRPNGATPKKLPEVQCSFDTVRVNYIGSTPSSWLVTRQCNLLVIVSYQLDPLEFRLAAGAAKRLESDFYDDPSISLLSTAAKYVEPADRAKFLELAAPSHELDSP